MIDTNKAIRLLLLADPGVGALVGSAIYVPRMDDGAPFPNIVFQTTGGESELYTPLIRPRVQFKCYFNDPDQPEKAREVYRALHDSLHGIKAVDLGGSDGFLLTAFEETHGQDQIDPEKGWPFVLSFYRFIFRE